MKVKNTWKEGLKKITAMITLVLVIAQSLPPAVFAQETTPAPDSGTDSVILSSEAPTPSDIGTPSDNSSSNPDPTGFSFNVNPDGSSPVAEPDSSPSVTDQPHTI